jgi:hypothetical protein
VDEWTDAPFTGRAVMDPGHSTRTIRQLTLCREYFVLETMRDSVSVAYGSDPLFNESIRKAVGNTDGVQITAPKLPNDRPTMLRVPDVPAPTSRTIDVRTADIPHRCHSRG